MQKTSAREHVYNILNAIENDTLNNVLAHAFKDENLNTQEKSYITNLTYQIFRYKLRLEALVRLYSHKNDLDKKAFNIMLIALCEMYFMTSIPVHASVNEAVSLAKKDIPKEVPLINAVLRKIDKTFPDKELDKKLYMKELKFLYQKKNPLELEATYASLPPFLLDILRKQYGREFAISYLNTLNDTPWYSYRFNASKKEYSGAKQEFMQTTSLTKEISAFGLSSPYRLPQIDELHKQGIVSMQGASSQILSSKLLEFVKDKEKIWDACCGVGGKSIPLLEQGIRIAYASDTNAKRLEVYNNELERLGLTSCGVQTYCSPLQEANISNVDCIILDAPCSGLGTLTANPDLRYKITKKSIAENIALQNELLNSSYSKLADKGIICYITCSLNKNENEHFIENFAKEENITILHNEYIMPSVSGADTLYLAVLQKN